MNDKLSLTTLDGLFGICKVKKGEGFPEWAVNKDSMYSITETSTEISVICPQERIPVSIEAEKGWKALKVMGPLDFSMTGVLSSIVKPLADAKISIFTISTYETDYIFIKQKEYENAVKVLRKKFNII